MPTCTLVDHGAALARIVGRPDSWDASLDAIQELQTGIAKATGARLPVDYTRVLPRMLEPARPTPVIVRFNLVPADERSLGKDGFRIRVLERSIDFDAHTRYGFLNAVYTFLTRYCGFLWLWPGAEGEIHNDLESLTIPTGEQTETPDYLWRWLLAGDFEADVQSKWTAMEFHMRPDRTSSEEFRLWCRRNRLGGLKVHLGHTWGEMIDPDIYGREHPEYFAETKGSRQESIANWDGKHGGQLCTSNPNVVDLMVEKIRKFFDDNPGFDAISISPNDGLGFCECDRCIALDVAFGNPAPEEDVKPDAALESTFKDDADRTSRPSRITGPITDRIFTFANQIAGKIAQSHPDKLLLLLVYSCYRTPPRQVKLAPNIIAQFCLQCHQYWDRCSFDADIRDLQALAQYASHLAIYEYYDQGNWPGVVRSFPDLISQSLKEFHRIGVRHYQPQAGPGFAVNGFNLWSLARTLWDTSCDVDALLEEYCSKAFGPAAENMRGYYNLWRKRWKECKGLKEFGDDVPGSTTARLQNTPFDQIRRLYPSEFLDTCARQIDQAKKAVPADSMERKRIDFTARGLEATRIAVEAANFSYHLAEQGWPMTHAEVTRDAVCALGPADQVRAKTHEALSYWERWEGYIESVRDDFVLSHFWTRYCYDSRKALHPHYALRRILELLDSCP